MKSGQTNNQPNTPKWMYTLLNQLFEIEKKLSVDETSDPNNCLRNIAKIKDLFETHGLFYENPTGQTFKETRTDLEANISGSGTENLCVVETLKPIIREVTLIEGEPHGSRIIQKGIVIVESVT